MMVVARPMASLGLLRAALAFLTGTLMLSLHGCQGGTAPPRELTAAEFEQQILNPRPTALVIFTATDDAPEQLDQLQIQLRAVLADGAPTFLVRSGEADWTREKYAVRQTPVVVAFHQQREIGRFLGPFQERPLSLWVTEISSRTADQPRVPESPPPQSVEEVEFQRLIGEGETPVLVDFWAEWCGPCKMLEAPLHELADDLQGRLVIAKVNVEEQKAIARQYVAGGLPLLVLFHRGKEVDRITGAPPRNELRRWAIAWANELASGASPAAPAATEADDR